MRTVRTHRLWYDLVAHRDRKPGEVHEVTDGRAAQIVERLPEGYVTVTEPKSEPKPEPKPEPVDLSTLTKATLLVLAEERGVKVPSKATKADIIKLLEV